MKQILQKYRVNLQTQFILFTSLTFTVIFLILALLIYQNQKEHIITSNETRMNAHLDDLINTINIYHEEKLNIIERAGNGLSKMLNQSDGGLVETDSLINISAKSFNKADPVNYKKVVDVQAKQWLFQGKQLQNGNHAFVDAQGETLGGLITFFQQTTKGSLVLQSNVFFGGNIRSENVLVNEEILNRAFNGEEFVERVRVDQTWTQSLYKPIKINNRNKGILYIGIPENIVERAQDIFNEIRYFNTGYPYAFNSNSKYLIHPYLKGDSIKHITDISTLKKDGQDKIRYLHEKDGELLWKWMYYEYYEPYDLFVATSVDEAEFLDKPLARVRNIIFIGLFIALLICISGIYLLVKTITNPIHIINDKLQALAQGKIVSSEAIERKDEMGDISNSVDKVINSFNAASEFANEIGKENYDTSFKPLSDEDILGNALVGMKNKLQLAKEEREQREWYNKGLAHFNDILREIGTDLETMTNEVLKNIIKYLHANQGAFYVVNGGKTENEKLELMAYYAWGRKKHLKQEILPGEGQVGQVWLEKEYIYIENIPEEYVNITSGLGEGAPRMALVLPLKLNDEVLGVIEIASFNKLFDYQIKFANAIGESIASTLASAKTNEKTKVLLEKTQQMTEMSRAQEEEMRQTLEELEATHEELDRREKKLSLEVKQLKEENEALKNKQEG